MIDQGTVIVEQSATREYPRVPPFSPSRAYPEYDGGELAAEFNAAYETVRDCFATAGLDRENFGRAAWNPLSDLIRPGETVLLKPNLIKETHPRDPRGWRYVLTHGSVVRAVADYVWKAVGRAGKVIVADAPQTDSSFSEIVRVLGLDTIADFYRRRGLAIELLDLRNEQWSRRDGVIVARRQLSGDPYGSVAFDLGADSEFAGHDRAPRYFGADYDRGETNFRHHRGRHQYLVCGSAMKCDVLFNLPKLKTHKKAGITVALKNLVGINADKNWLPHYTEGCPGEGGDERPAANLLHRCERLAVLRCERLSAAVPVAGPALHRTARRLGVRVFGDTERVIRSGNWHGNDTIWRTCLDLNKLVLYGAPDGTLREYAPHSRRRHFVLVDGIVAGQGSGPMNPDPLAAGLVLFGVHPASVDAAAACLMGFDPEAIPIVRQAFGCKRYPLAEWGWRDVRLASSRRKWCRMLPAIDAAATFHFEPHFGWAGHIERYRQENVRADG